MKESTCVVWALRLFLMLFQEECSICISLLWHCEFEIWWACFSTMRIMRFCLICFVIWMSLFYLPLLFFPLFYVISLIADATVSTRSAISSIILFVSGFTSSDIFCKYIYYLSWVNFFILFQNINNCFFTWVLTNFIIVSVW